MSSQTFMTFIILSNTKYFEEILVYEKKEHWNIFLYK